MKATALLRLERKIATADQGGIVERWRYGRRLLADPKLCTPAGHLRHGVAEGLVRAARNAGLRLSEREIRRRLQAARTYPSEAEIGRQAADFEGGWMALADAGFPAPDAPDGDLQPALVDRAGHLEPGAEPWGQPALDDDDGTVFPREIRVGRATLDRDHATLGTLAGYLADRSRWTEAHARRNAQMRDRLAELLGAVGGDQSVTYSAAVDALRRGVPAGAR